MSRRVVGALVGMAVAAGPVVALVLTPAPQPHRVAVHRSDTGGTYPRALLTANHPTTTGRPAP